MSANQFDYDNLKSVELWEKLCQGDKEALAALFNDNFDSLYRYGYRIVPNTDLVRDSIQEVFYNLWKYRNNLNQPDSIKAYLFISLRRQLLRKKKNIERRQDIDKKYFSEEFDVLPNYQVWQETLELGEEEHEGLKEAIAELTPRQREVIYLKYFEGLSTNELAEVLQIRAQSIYNLVYDALENLRIFLKN
ncbi:sigma-70 family RNA polymerase sigma factor [Fodinibius sp.]|uniref:RNA polymerase sigma factor n=1 Tax=Fodinibius sp. TaxID=1872440 RepID=UPI002ACE0CF5|nr:sigma-70 family RNA polymerase sigma factor [Fodinibius sp.]MDZ7659356.1 sigma-70 family RNA polymerase sigma factor [Fodinibius sp.]